MPMSERQSFFALADLNFDIIYPAEHPTAARFNKMEHLKVDRKARKITRVPDIGSQTVAGLPNGSGKPELTGSARINLKAIEHSQQYITSANSIFVDGSDFGGNLLVCIHSGLKIRYKGDSFQFLGKLRLVPRAENFMILRYELFLDLIEIVLVLRVKS